MKILPFLLFPFVAVAAPEIITLDKATNGVLPFVAVSNMIPARSNHLVTSWHLNQTTGTLFSVVTGSSALAFLHTTNYIKGETNTLNLKIDGLSNSVVVITNDLQGQILSQSNRITGVSNYVVSITDDYVRTNHTLAINGIVGNFDSNLSYTIPVGALVGTTNYIDAGDLAGTNYADSVTNNLRNELTNSLRTKTLVVSNLTANGNSLITNGSLRVYSSAGSGTPDFQIGRYDNLLGFGFNAKNESTQPIANNPWFRIAGGANDGIVLNPGNAGSFIILGNDKWATIALGSGASKVGVNTLSPVSGFAFDVAGSVYVRTNLFVAKTTTVDTIVITNNVLGSRELLTFGKTSGGTTNFYGGYAALTGSTNASIIAIRDGSIIGMSSRFNVTAQTTAGDLWCEVWIEDTVALSNKVAISGTGWYNCIATTNRGVYPFVAGKPLIVYHRYVGFAGSIGAIYDSIEIVNDN